MSSMKTIKKRIESLSNTRQIMKAINMSSAAKLQTARIRLDGARQMLDGAKRMMENIKNGVDAEEHDFLRERPIENTAYVVITSDKGLCCEYNLSISKKALTFMDERQNETIISVGLKGSEYLRRYGKTVLRRYADISESALYEDAERIAELLSVLYASGEIDEAYIAYTRFETALSHVPNIVRILPIGGDFDDEHPNVRMGFDPDAETLIEHAAQMYLNAYVYCAMVEASACEHAARMMSMDSAANNAGEIIENLTREYNRGRQSDITQEINEIVAGATIND